MKTRARQFYFDYVEVHSAVVDRGRLKSTLELDELAVTCRAGSKPAHPTATTVKSFWNFSATKWLAVLPALVLLGVVVGWTMQAQSPPLADGVVPKTEANLGKDERDDPFYLAQVVSVTPERVWGRSSTASDFLLRIR